MSTSSLPERVTVVEVGPRDGLQNESAAVASEVKVELVERLASAGLPAVEVTSFVDPRRVPQLADAAQVYAAVRRREGVRYPALVPNLQGLKRALDAGVTEIAVFASATEAFSQRNLGRSRSEVMSSVSAVCEASPVPVRGYLSMVFADPWEGEVSPSTVVSQGRLMLDAGCYELSLGDTTGAGTPAHVGRLLEEFGHTQRLALHCHDTYGQALANVLTGLHAGVCVFDASVGGLGGCPFAGSATGNLATEDLLWMLDGLGVATGADVGAVARTARWICELMGKPIPGRAARALSGGG